MVEIQIDIADKIPLVTGSVQCIVTDNSDYTVRFTFDKQWDQSEKTAYFVLDNGYAYAPVVLHDNMATLPRIIDGTASKYLYVGVQQGELRTSRACAIPIHPSVTDMIDDEAVPPAPDMWENIIYRLENLEQSSSGFGLTAAQISALDGMFKIASFTADPTAAYNAFKSAFGIGGNTPDIPDEPDVPAKTLEAIGATYSGGDVPVGTAITDLIGITVTAYYSDGSTSNVTDYTMNGGIYYEGGNVITVFYNGFSTQFVVFGVAESAGSGSVVDGVIMDDWDVIAEKVENGTASAVYALGNTKELPVTYEDGTTETFTVEIIGFNHDDKADGSGKAGITFGCINTSVGTMVYSTNNSAGWTESAARTYCNGDLFHSLPDKLQTAIKTVNKLVDGGNGNPVLVTTADKVWLFSPEELSTTLPTDFYTVTGQGSLYAAYEQTNKPVRVATDGTKGSWWTRSSGIGANGYVFMITDTGAYNSQVISQSRRICFGFCI